MFHLNHFIDWFWAVSYTHLDVYKRQRLHSANLGHPIVCDALYGLTNPVYISSLKKKYKMSKDILEETPILNRLALHAFSLKFTTAKGKQIVAEAPLSKDMDAMLKQCNKWLKQ